MTRTYIFLAVCLCMSANAWCQFNKTIRSGRPGQSIGAFTIGRGIFQIQSGFDGYRSKSADLTTSGILSNNVIRFGFTESFEFNSLIEYKSEVTTVNDHQVRSNGLSALDLGMRFHIYSGHDLIPSVSFQFRTRIPVLGKPYQIKDLAPRFIIVTGQQLSKVFYLTTNLGAEWNGINLTASGTYAVNLSFPYTSSLGGYIEVFGNLQDQMLATNIDTGLAWLVNNDLQLDFYGGYGRNFGIENYFASVGISWRTKQLKESKVK